MQNIDVRFNATSNFGRARADLSALQAQALALAGVFERNAFARPPMVVDPTSWRRSTRAIHEASRVYRDAASSSGLLTTQQIRATSEAERYTRALQRQQLSLGEMRRHSGIMREVYRDQLRYQRMTAQYWGSDSSGRAITDITIPRNVPRDLDRTAQRLHFVGQMARSASTQIINMGKNMQWAGRQLTVGFTYPVALFGAAAGVMAYKVEDSFGKINKVYDYSSKALTDQNQLIKEQADLRTQSMKMAEEVAKRYGLTVEKTLAVEQDLAATGLTIKDGLLQATKEVQRISALGDIDPVQTTEMVVALQTAFKIKGDELTRTLNFMNAASNATSLSLQDIAEATPRAASGMAALGGTAEEMTILLVSMREAGVVAAEGANALKSATSRILNPAILKKATDIYASFGADIDVGAIADKSGGKMFEFLKLLGKAQQENDKLTQKQKQSAVAALFGTWQFNRLTAALTNTADAYSGVQNQTAKAIELQKMSAAELEHIAMVSEKAMTQTPAAKFRKAWAEFQIQLAEVGKPFLEVATVALQAASDVAKFFNNMDKWKKVAIAAVIAIMAIAGPIVMLGGLMMNLGGQFVRGSATILSALGRMGGAMALRTREETAAMRTTEAQNQAMQRAGATTNTLAQEVNVLTAAYERAILVARSFAETQGVLAGTQGAAAGAAAAAAARAQTWNPVTSQQAFLGMPGGMASSAYVQPVQRTAAAYDQAASRAQTLAAAERQRLNDQTRNNRAALAEQRIRTNIEQRVNGTSVAMAGMSLAMAGMLVTNNEFVNTLSKWLLIGVLVVPAIKAVATGTALAARNAWSMAAANFAAARGAQANAAATAATAGRMATLRAGASGAMAGFGAIMGPVGWILTGVAAVGVGLYMWKKHLDGIKKESIETNKALNNTAADWAESMGRVRKEYQRISTIGIRDIATNQSQFNTEVDYYKSGKGKKSRQAFEELGPEEQRRRAAEIYIDLMVETGATAKQAAQNIAALYVASGASSAEANGEAQKLLKTVGDIKKVDWGQAMRNQGKLLVDELVRTDRASEEVIKASGKDIAKTFSQAFAQADTRKEANKVMNDLTSVVNEGWNKIFKSGAGDLPAFFKKMGVESGAELKKAFEEGRIDSQDISMFARGDRLEIQPMLHLALELDKAVAESVAEYNNMGDSIHSITDLQNEMNIRAKLLSYDGAVASAKELMTTFRRNQDLNQFMDKIVGTEIDAKKTAELEASMNAFADANSIKRGKTALETYNNLLNNVKVEAKEAGEEADGISKKIAKIPGLKTVTINVNQVGGILQTAMSSVQNRMADSAMDQLGRSWDAQMDAAQASWDNRTDVLEAAHDAQMRKLDDSQEAAQEAFDKRWEKRKETIEKTYQRRIDRVNREIETEQRADQIRQQLFDREKARLAAIAASQNTNIDFNTAINEGRLDDAAKIANNAAADAGNAQMEAEQAAAEARSQARIDALEKKNERLEKAKDKELKNLENLEERMRKRLERIQDARRRALEKQQQEESKALQRSQEAAMRSMERRRDYDEAMLEQRLELFKSYTARNQKDLEKWMRHVGLSYDDFGSDVKAKGEEWSTYFRKELASQIRAAGVQVKNDKIWENVGKGIANNLLKGLGFKNLAEFNRFVNTGSKADPKAPETRHDGGVIGSGGGSRGSIPNTYKGLHRTEKMIRGQIGEYVVNKDSAAKWGPMLDAINNGTDVDGVMGGFGGPVGLISGAVSQMFSKGLKQAFNNAYQAGLAKQWANAAPGSMFSGVAGTYGGRFFSAQQMKNAATIASVGAGMGMSTRDQMIGIMTAIAESGLVNVNYGDRDSLGLFQQRPSMGWGTAAQVTDPRYAAGKFFSVLKSHDERNAEAPWLAAQHVQRSAFSDGSNYAKWWAAAQAIFGSGLTKIGVGAGMGFVPGKGGKHRPISGAVTSGLHGGNSFGNPPAVDLAGPTGRPVYAVADGHITSSRDIAGPLSSDRYRGDGPYGSFGRMIQMQTDSGAGILYAHLSRRSVGTGQRVKGGSVIGYSGNTGNSSGPHLHFGATNGPYAWLRRGGKIRYDNTPVMAHKNETMLSARMTKHFEDNIASGGANEYNVTIDMRGATITDNVDIEAAVNKALDARESKLGRKRKVT